MKRIAIIGSPGAGKSTFAKKLAEQIDIPLIHLDYYYHDKQHDFYTNKEAWRSKANEFAENEEWIIDGNYGATMTKRFERADTIFYFNLPTYMAVVGIVNRWLTANKSDRPEMPNDWQEKPSLSFLWRVLRFRKHYASGTQQLLAQNSDKTIITFNNRKQAAEYLGNLA